jgi:hypothetical protein
MLQDLYKFGITGKTNVEDRFKDCSYNVDVKWSWWLPEEMVMLGESLMLAVTKKDFYLVEQLDGITEMRVYDDKEAKRIIANLYDVKNDFINKYPQFRTPDYNTWKKLYFVKVIA